MEKRKKFPSEAVEELPDLMKEQTLIALGSFGWTWMARKYTRILAPYAINVPGAGLATPAELSRFYLTAKYGDQKRRLMRGQREEITGHRNPPLYAKPCRLDDAVYVDIKAAYWSIVSIVGWDVDYMPGEWVGVRSEMNDFPYAGEKLIRNLLVTAALPKTVQLWNGFRLQTKGTYNPLLNHSIWAFCQDVLNGIASEMIAAGAVYVHTDGYVLPSAYADSALGIIADWGLTGSVKQRGQGWVAGVGTYRVGQGVSRRKLHNAEPFMEPLYTPHREWLKGRLRFWSERGGRF